MTAKNQQNNTDSNDRYMTRYSSPVISRGLELAKKVSVATAIDRDKPPSYNQYDRDAQYFLNLAIEQITSSDYQDALINLLKVLDIDPDYYHDAYSIYLDKKIQAAENFSSAIELNPGYSKNYLEQFSEDDSLSSTVALMLVDLGINFQKQYFYLKAIESFDRAIILNPNNSQAYNRRSTARSAIGDYQGAMEDLQQVRMI